MTRDEFDKREAEILTAIPEEFHSFVRTLAWEYGHSSGYDEVLNYDETFVWSLKPAIEAFQKRG